MSQWAYIGIYGFCLFALMVVVIVASAMRVFQMILSLFRSKPNLESIVVFFILLSFSAITLVVMRSIVGGEATSVLRDALFPTNTSYLSAINDISKFAASKIEQFLSTIIGTVTGTGG